MPREQSLTGRRVIITGAARGIGALTARRLHSRGARVALLGLEPELLADVAAACGDAPWCECDVTDRDQVDQAVAEAVERLGGLDVAIANAGIGAQMTLVDGDSGVWDATFAVNLIGTYNLVRAAGPHVSHRDGYFLLTASLAAAVHLPLMSAYCASKAAVESLGDSLRIELRPSGARVGVAYYAELDTDMTSRGFATKAAARMPLGGHGHGAGGSRRAGDRRPRARDRGGARGGSSRPRWVGAALRAREARPAGGRARGPARAGQDAGDRAGRAGAAHDSPAGAHAGEAALPRGRGAGGRRASPPRPLGPAATCASPPRTASRCRPRSPATAPSRRGPRSWSSAPTDGTAAPSTPAAPTTTCSSRSAAPATATAASTRSARAPSATSPRSCAGPVAQPWSDGRLGLNGFSASAITIYNSLHLRLPCVKAAVLKSGTLRALPRPALARRHQQPRAGAGVLALIGAPALAQGARPAAARPAVRARTSPPG